MAGQNFLVGESPRMNVSGRVQRCGNSGLQLCKKRPPSLEPGYLRGQDEFQDREEKPEKEQERTAEKLLCKSADAFPPPTEVSC